MATKKTRPQWEYVATLVRVLDGDTAIFRVERTFSMDVDFGFFVKDRMSLTKSAEVTFRFAGIDSPEIHGTDKSQVKAGNAALAETKRLLSLGPIRLVSYKQDKYGRWLADVFVTPPGGEEIWVNKSLLDGKFALPYGG